MLSYSSPTTRTPNSRMQDPNIKIGSASLDDLEDLTSLFDGYRQFYRYPSDLSGARAFIRDRLRNRDSIIFIAWHEGKAVGFTQLYPTFSSLWMTRLFVLSDLFVAESARKLGAGRLLLDAAAEHGRSAGARYLTLETARTNLTAQSLYEGCGWKRDHEFFVYELVLR
jgi:ribosomal protein S18 acetylase RimI-like enzyme